MAKKDYDNEILTLEKKIQQAREKIKRTKAQRSEAQRKARTHRLIEIGAIVESVLGRELDDDDKIRLEKFLIYQDRRGNYFTRAMSEPVDPKPVDSSEKTDKAGAVTAPTGAEKIKMHAENFSG